MDESNRRSGWKAATFARQRRLAGSGARTVVELWRKREVAQPNVNESAISLPQNLMQTNLGNSAIPLTRCINLDRHAATICMADH